ncbi:helix-turn-helix domain-containing protein [Anaeromicropila populeti]|uniref:Transcriptional regulator, contains XRE-family HTH domain n=1 Tax=Anaeromicropila populeti TaxID=37658 RepID=A0A1I6JHM5_9FIRM|nr:helix-turn-helix transcriptional regulator [Anaeromicropila populeti]SFR78498.1 Transcriptional regulator, contains XRE-family HTH domain [Anaeromicropila populeti]
MNNKEIGERIKTKREENHLTISELAKKVGVADSTISRYERGIIEKIKLPVIQSIAAALGVNPVWIIGESTECEIKEKFVLDDSYFSFAKEMQQKKVSKDDMEKLWKFYDMIKKI